ncbi:MAG: ribose 5-phosphate isomerase B [Spirochaetes bacterium]|nr:ribose 5-phosphate isomerase B [Spirochaetota bacterium]
MRILAAADHGGFELKNLIVAHLRGRGFDLVDLGVNDGASVDYPDLARRAVETYRGGGFEFGLLFCGTGIGISIAANKMNGIRCALPFTPFMAEMARAHNNANFLAFGGRVEYPVPVAALVDAFLAAKHEGGRHGDRVKKIHALEDT